MTAQGKGDALHECIADWREQAAAEENCQRSGGDPKGATAYRHCADDLESTLAEMQPASPTPSADLVKEARGMLKKGAVDDFTPARVAEIEGFAIDQTDGLVMDFALKYARRGRWLRVSPTRSRRRRGRCAR